MNLLKTTVVFSLLSTGFSVQAHECPDPQTKHLNEIFSAAFKATTMPDKTHFKDGMRLYMYIAREATRPEDQGIREASCQYLANILYDLERTDLRDSYLKDCPADTWDKLLKLMQPDPDSFYSDEPYLPIVRVSPRYPEEALAAGLSGQVELEFSVSRKGTIRSPKIISSTNEIFNDEALNSVKKFKYEPRRKKGRAVTVKGVRTRISFDYDAVTHPDHCSD